MGQEVAGGGDPLEGRSTSALRCAALQQAQVGGGGLVGGAGPLSRQLSSFWCRQCVVCAVVTVTYGRWVGVLFHVAVHAWRHTSGDLGLLKDRDCSPVLN
jgi:hypothetical protein